MVRASSHVVTGSYLLFKDCTRFRYLMASDGAVMDARRSDPIYSLCCSFVIVRITSRATYIGRKLLSELVESGRDGRC